MTKHEKNRVLCSFQLWLAENYNTLPTHSGALTQRSRKFIKEKPKAFDSIF
tara:strand:- start:137 stop:289 length:153 start_codon:yes stop_codon:yes gene_type:complete